MGMTECGVRIKLARKHAGLTQEQLATACGWDQSRVGNYEAASKPRTPGVEDVKAIARATGVSWVWLLTGDGEMLGPDLPPNAGDLRPIRTWENPDELDGDQDFVMRRYAAVAEMGKGRDVVSEPETLQGDVYRKSFARRAGWREDTHFALAVEGDSMIEAGLRDGWSVVFDSTDKAVEQGEIYVIEVVEGDRVRRYVKHLELVPGGGLRIISANSSHPVFREPITLDAERASHVNILGRVVHLQGLIGRKKAR